MSARPQNSIGLSVVATVSHADTTHARFSTTIIELLAEVLGVDPTVKKLHLEEHFSLDDLDRGMKADYEAGRSTRASFDYGGYVVRCSSCGTVTILADKEDYENGEVPLPASMRDN